jgi:hypothetical protein
VFAESRWDFSDKLLATNNLLPTGRRFPRAKKDVDFEKKDGFRENCAANSCTLELGWIIVTKLGNCSEFWPKREAVVIRIISKVAENGRKRLNES